MGSRCGPRSLASATAPKKADRMSCMPLAVRPPAGPERTSSDRPKSGGLAYDFPVIPAPPTRYTSAAIVSHWLMAVLMIVVGVLGLLHDTWPRSTQAYWINVHAMIGLALWLLVIARILRRLAHPAPALPPDAGEFSRRLALPVHVLMYMLLFVIPIVGIVTFIWHGRVFNFGLFTLNFGVKSNHAVFHPTEDWHGYLAYALFTLAGLHALAALWHHFIRRDSVLRRMWPGAALSPASED
jgi:cytochrome b561